MRICILETDTYEDLPLDEHQSISEMFRSWLQPSLPEADWTSVAVHSGERLPAPDEFQGYLITGSRHGVYDELPWMSPLVEFIHQLRVSETPVAGICFGHQIMADVYGGKAEKAEIGNVVGARGFDYGGACVDAFVWHQDQVTQRPQGARVLAGNAFCENAILAYGDTIWTVQPHPEYGADFIRGLIRTRGPGVVPDDQLRLADETLDGPVANDQMADHMAAFFLKERA